MKSQMKSRLKKLNRQELISLCNEKLICAARDLAEFTKNGINASFIVALAHKCEHFEQNQKTPASKQAESDRGIEKEIMDAVSRICELGRKIWSQNPERYNDYLIPVSIQHDPTAEPRSAR